MDSLRWISGVEPLIRWSVSEELTVPTVSGSVGYTDFELLLDVNVTWARLGRGWRHCRRRLRWSRRRLLVLSRTPITGQLSQQSLARCAPC